MAYGMVREKTTPLIDKVFSHAFPHRGQARSRSLPTRVPLPVLAEWLGRGEPRLSFCVLFLPLKDVRLLSSRHWACPCGLLLKTLSSMNLTL
jgi:hypothetical protein